MQSVGMGIVIAVPPRTTSGCGGVLAGLKESGIFRTLAMDGVVEKSFHDIVGPLVPAATHGLLNPSTPYEVQAGTTLFSW